MGTPTKAQVLSRPLNQRYYVCTFTGGKRKRAGFLDHLAFPVEAGNQADAKYRR